MFYSVINWFSDLRTINLIWLTINNIAFRISEKRLILFLNGLQTPASHPFPLPMVLCDEELL